MITVCQLKIQAKEQGVKGFSKMRKGELLKVVRHPSGVSYASSPTGDKREGAKVKTVKKSPAKASPASGGTRAERIKALKARVAPHKVKTNRMFRTSNMVEVHRGDGTWYPQKI